MRAAVLAALVAPTAAYQLASAVAPRVALSRSGRPVCTASLEAPADSAVREDIRNIAIVAHVDHGKTTLVDAMLESAKAIKDARGDAEKLDTVMDSNDQERERGITILAKNAALTYEGVKMNIVDTPGHADFGGEVERVLGMVDGVLLLVDAQEGPKPQTRFVLKKALKLGLTVLVVVNKIDKPAARIDYVIDKTFDLFCELGATDEQTDFPIVYTSAINRVAGLEPDEIGEDMSAIFERIMALPKPKADSSKPLQLQISNIGSDPFIGRLGIGRILSGTLARNTPIGLSAGPGTKVKQVKVGELFNFDAAGRNPIDSAAAGEIVVFSGISEFNIGDTLVDLDDPQPLEPIEVEVPTMSITMGVNKSPFAGKSGAKLCAPRTGRTRRDRLAVAALASSGARAPAPARRSLLSPPPRPRSVDDSSSRRLCSQADRPQHPRPACQGARDERGDEGGGHRRRRHGARVGSRAAAPDRADRDDAPRGLRDDGGAAHRHREAN